MFNIYVVSVKLLNVANICRYRLDNKEVMIKLVNAVNINNKRLPQLYKICEVLNISVISPIILNNNNYWFTDLITYNIKNYIQQLCIRVNNKYI